MQWLLASGDMQKFVDKMNTDAIHSQFAAELKIILFVTEMNPRAKTILSVTESLLEPYQSLHGELQGLKEILYLSWSSCFNSLFYTMVKNITLTCSRDKDSNLHFVCLDFALYMAVHRQGPICLQGSKQIMDFNMGRPWTRTRKKNPTKQHINKGRNRERRKAPMKRD